ncbi:two-component sensor histidine kinase, partial [Helicobacter pylori]
NIKNELEAMGLNLSYHYSNGIICFNIHDCVFNCFYDLEEVDEELPPPPPENLKEVSGMKGIEKANYGVKEKQ